MNIFVLDKDPIISAQMQCDKHVVKMQLATIEVPTTIFVISKQYDNNFFYIDLPDTNESELIEIPEGNYDLIGLQDTLNNKLKLILSC